MKNKSGHTSAVMPSCIVAALSLCALNIAALCGYLPPTVPVLYLAATALTFFIYAADKACAKTNRNRVPEKFLHLCSLAGGWPGALLAQAILRHKTRKQPFRTIFWLSVVLNLGALYWFVFENGCC